jgi:hypothetical protein
VQVLAFDALPQDVTLIGCSELPTAGANEDKQ